MPTYVKYVDGRITQHGNFKFPGSQLVNFEVVTGYDGLFYEKGKEPKKPDELIISENFALLRSERNTRLNSVLWMVERHSQEKELNIKTTLTDEQYITLLQYIQNLRELPQLEGSPWDGGKEETPWPVLDIGV